MEKYELMHNSIMHNIGELSEFLVDTFEITNYYDLVDFMIDLYNFRVKVFKQDKKLGIEIMKELESESEE